MSLFLCWAGHSPGKEARKISWESSSSNLPAPQAEPSLSGFSHGPPSSHTHWPHSSPSQEPQALSMAVVTLVSLHQAMQRNVHTGFSQHQLPHLSVLPLLIA